MKADLLRRATPEDAIGTMQNYLVIAHRYDYEPEPEVILGLLKDMGYTLRRLPRKEANAG